MNAEDAEGIEALGATGVGDGLMERTVLAAPPKGRAVLLYALLPGARLVAGAGVWVMGTGFMISSGSSYRK